MTIDQLLQNAQLSLASYANLEPGLTPTEYRRRLQQAGMSEAQAIQFTGLYPDLVAFYDDTKVRSEGANTGFQVAVLKDASGNVSIAFRGVSGFDDAQAVLDIKGFGAAYGETGMAVSAEIAIGKRRVIEFFLDPIRKAVNEGLRER